MSDNVDKVGFSRRAVEPGFRWCRTLPCSFLCLSVFLSHPLAVSLLNPITPFLFQSCTISLVNNFFFSIFNFFLMLFAGMGSLVGFSVRPDSGTFSFFLLCLDHVETSLLSPSNVVNPECCAQPLPWKHPLRQHPASHQVGRLAFLGLRRMLRTLKCYQ